jgi:hypothetical protein
VNESSVMLTMPNSRGEDMPWLLRPNNRQSACEHSDAPCPEPKQVDRRTSRIASGDYPL